MSTSIPILKDNLEMMGSELSRVFSRLNEGEMVRLVDGILESGTIFIAGAGRSGLLLKCCAMRLMHMDKPVYIIGEIVTPAIRRGDMMLIASGSGETESLVVMARKAKKLGARIALITANPGSTIATLSAMTVHIPAPSPKAQLDNYVPSAQPMGNLFEQSMFMIMDSVVMELMERTGKTSEIMFQRHANLE